MRKYLDLFVSEAAEHIQAAGNDVSRLANGLAPAETLNALFRHFHSIKGMAASMGFEPTAALSHAVEDLLDRLRKGQAQPPAALADLLMEALDALSAMVGQAARGEPDGEPGEATRVLVEKFRAPAPPGAASCAPEAGARHYRCRFTIDPAAQFPGARAALVLKRLESVGRIARTEPGRETLPQAGAVGDIIVELTSERGEAAIRNALSDLLDLKGFELSEAAPGRAEVPAPGTAPDPGASTVRIPTGSLDAFLDAIAAMIARRGALSGAIRNRDLDAAGEALRKLSESMDELRVHVMRIRLMPFEHISDRLTRTVRDLCRRTGKRVALQISGADVSLDRSVLEDIIDPLNHILRNAVDHGIELPAERELMGKQPEGTVRIELTRAGEQVVIAVEDDGRGMDKEAIERTAVAGGFASPAELAAMDEASIFLLATIPGFSTVTKVTDVSGRGVGMDIVRTRIEALHGHMRIASRRAQSTRIEMTLPLTVAVIDAFLVECRAGLFAVPAGAVASVEQADPRRVRATPGGTFLASRPAEDGEPASFVPLVRLDEAFGAPGPARPDAPLQVLAYQANGTRGAIAVDRIRERREVVVKPLGAPLERLRKYSGAALLDDGSVALILDLVNLSRG